MHLCAVGLHSAYAQSLPEFSTLAAAVGVFTRSRPGADVRIPLERHRASRIQQKTLDRLEERRPRRLVPLRHMVFGFQNHELGIRNRRCDAASLLKRYEIVVSAVHDQCWRRYLGQQVDNIDLVEGAAQPDGVFRRRCHPLQFRQPPDLLGRRIGKEPRAQHLLKAECSSPQPSRIRVRKVFTSKPFRGPRLFQPSAYPPCRTIFVTRSGWRTAWAIDIEAPCDMPRSA